MLLDNLRRLRAQGTACIYISHKLDEVFALADRITVLRDGASIITVAARDTTVLQVIKHMVGREITDLFPRRSGWSALTPTRLDAKPAEQRVEVNALHPQPVLTVRNLSVAHRAETLRCMQHRVVQILARAVQLAEAMPEVLAALGEAFCAGAANVWTPDGAGGLILAHAWQEIGRAHV